MEAVPKLPMISFELKISSEKTHFGPKLKQYISEAYREDPDSYGNEIHQLECLRSAAIRPSIDSSGVRTLVRYFCQLQAMQTRFPMSEGQAAACAFSWKDVYSNASFSQADIHYEMSSILYNIGALHTQLAASEPRTSAESLKAACTHYQNAAWAFMYLRQHFPQHPTVDISSEMTRLLQEICFAQAQECILDKSIQDTKKPSVVVSHDLDMLLFTQDLIYDVLNYYGAMFIGAVATQVQFFYRNSLAMLGPSTGLDTVHEIIGGKLYNYWHRYLSFKQSYIACIVCLYQGLNAEEQQKFGERVAYYQQSVDRLHEARKLAKYIEPVQITTEALTFTNDVVEGKRKAAKNENEFIYHEEVPDKTLLVELKPVCLVKTLPIDMTDPEMAGPDIFARLVPIGAHEASSRYSEEKAKLLRQVVSLAEAKNSELMEFMSSLQLEQLEVIDVNQKVPQEIVDRCAAMNAKSDVIQTLVDSMNGLAEIISDVEHSLADIKTMIQEETLKEKEYQKVMGPRPPSIVQTELSREFHKYQEAHTRTNESNQVLHKAMTLHIANLRLLAQPLDVLQAKIPCIDNIEGLDRETMLEMRRVVGKVREMQAQRETLIQALREAITSDDITELLARTSDSPEEIFKHELEKHSPQVKVIEQNLAAQENIINKLTQLYAAYGESRRMLTDVLRKRDGLINALVTSYDSYPELLGKSQKGLEFYKKLRGNVAQLAARMRSTCQVQREERDTHLANNKTPAAVPTTSTGVKFSDLPPSSSSSGGGSMKLKDYLPFMKNRALAGTTPQPPVDNLPTDYYPDSIYPTSVRPTPLGSEATDQAQSKLPDGVVVPPQTYRYPPYDDYPAPYAFPATSKAPDKTEDYGYPSSYTPPQYSSQATDLQYSNPYYSATQNNTTVVTDSMPYSNQPHTYQEPYTPGQFPHTPEAVLSISAYNAGMADLNTNFAQMQVGNQAPKSDVPNYVTNYNHGYGTSYPQVSTTNVYSLAHNQNTGGVVQSQMPEYNQYPYSNETPNQFNQTTSMPYVANQAMPSQSNPYGPGQSMANPASNNYSVPDTHYNYTGPYDHGYTIYTNTDSAATSTTNVVTLPILTPVSSVQAYNFPSDSEQFGNSAALAQFDAMDQPIKSHVTGEALGPNYQSTFQNYNQNTNFGNPTDPNYQNPEQNYNTQNYQVAVSTYAEQNYGQNYQNHPGYTYNANSGMYEYNYGSQNSSTTNIQNTQPNINPQGDQEQKWNPQGVYTSAGGCETVQSPSEQVAQPGSDQNSQIYYNVPYGYITGTNQADNVVPDQTVSTNYGANVNQSTYMQSGQRNTNVTYTNSNDQVSSPKENVIEPPDFTPNQTEDVPGAIEGAAIDSTVSTDTLVPDPKSELSTFDLLSEIDFTVEQKPLMPEIKVPPISESVVIKPKIVKSEPLKPVIKEEVIERPAKRDLFSDPILLNKFTQEVKKLQQLTDSLTNKAAGGLTVLDAKWKTFQDVQSKEMTSRSLSVALSHSGGNALTEVVPYDDSRLRLKSDPDAYINASYYKQLSPWCIPLVISDTPSEEEYSTFWKAILEYKMTCVVCLLSEIEMQGKFYWPTAKGQSLDLAGDLKVTLEEVTCTVHWTERKLVLACGKTVLNVTHYQINVFPAKTVCSPLVLLTDRILQQCFEGRLSNQLGGAWLQTSAGRGAVLALLLCSMCHARAGLPDLTDMLDESCINLYKHRTNVLEDTKYLADAYRTVLFYVQGVLCSGTTMFNGEAVSGQTGALVLPPVTPTGPPPSPPIKPQKFSRESFEEMKQSPGLKSGDMKDPLNFLDPLWSLKKK